MGIVVSLAIAGAIFQNQALSKIVRVLPHVDKASLREAITGTDSTYISSLPPADRAKVIGGIADAIGSVYIVVIVAGATTVVLACFLPVRD